MPTIVRYLLEVFLVAMKLGEMLVREGKITSGELEETLKGQAIFGGRFGTNLVEMGFLDEQELTRFLSQKTGVPQASAEQLMNIPPQVIRLLPENAVRKYRVVPVALNNRKLSLAMTDPWDFAAIDEISFSTGYIVVPFITPELRLICALEKYYNIKRELRYIPVAGGGRNRGRTNRPAFSEEGAVPAPPPLEQKAALGMTPASAPDEGDFFELPPLDELASFGDMDETQTPVSLPGVGMRREAETDYSLDGVLNGLARAFDRNAIAELIVGYTARQFNRSALFLVKGDRATGWIGRAGDQSLPGFDTLALSLDEPSVLKTVAESKTYFLGALPITPCNGKISAALGGVPTTERLLVPLIMSGRVVAVLCLDGVAGQLQESIPALQKLLAKGSMAFEILILRSKILLT